VSINNYTDIKFTGYRMSNKDNVILQAWIINEYGDKVFISDFPNYLRRKKLEKIIDKMNVRIK